MATQIEYALMAGCAYQTNLRLVQSCRLNQKV